MGTRIVPGFCTHIEVDAENRTTEASFAFMTPQDPEDFAGLMVRLAGGVEVIINVDDGED